MLHRAKREITVQTVEEPKQNYSDEMLQCTSNRASKSAINLAMCLGKLSILRNGSLGVSFARICQICESYITK